MPDIAATRISRRRLFGKLGVIAAGVAAAAALPVPAVAAAPDLERRMMEMFTTTQPVLEELPLRSMLASMENMGLIEQQDMLIFGGEASLDPVIVRTRETIAERIDALLDGVAKAGQTPIGINLGAGTYGSLVGQANYEGWIGEDVDSLTHYWDYPIDLTHSADPNHLSVELKPDHPSFARLWAERSPDGELLYVALPDPTYQGEPLPEFTHETGVHERWTGDEVRWMLRQRELGAGDPGYVWGVATSGPGDVARLTSHYSTLVDRGLMWADEAGYRLNRALGETHETAQRYAGWWAQTNPERAYSTMAARQAARTFEAAQSGVHTARFV